MFLPLPCSCPLLPRVPGELMDRVRRRAARVETGGEEVVGEQTLARLHKQVTQVHPIAVNLYSTPVHIKFSATLPRTETLFAGPCIV